MNLNVLYEDQHLIVVVKPPKVPSQSDPSGDIDMLTALGMYMKKKQPKESNPYIALLHRLDRPVGGIMVFAKSKFACANMNKQIQDKKVSKSYYCVVSGQLDQEKGRLLDYLKRIKTINKSKVVAPHTPSSKEAILEYKVLETIEDDIWGPLSLLKINLITGRHHQIRVQLSHLGHPIWGDTKYNRGFGRSGQWTQIALFAGELTFTHPKTNQNMAYSQLPASVEPFTMFKCIKEANECNHIQKDV